MTRLTDEQQRILDHERGPAAHRRRRRHGQDGHAPARDRRADRGGHEPRRDPLPHLHGRGDQGDAPARARRARRPRGHRSRRADRPDLPRVRRLDRARARAADRPRGGRGAARPRPPVAARARGPRPLRVRPTSRSAGCRPSSARCSTLHEEMLRHVVTPDEVRAWCAAQPADDEVARDRAEAVQAVEAYRALKLERDALDFGDQIALAVELLRTRPEVLERLRSRFRFVFLDEYQDTDVAQRELVKLVAADAAAGLRRRRRRPGDLRLARRDDPQHVRLRRRLPRRALRDAVDQLPLRQADPRPGERADRRSGSGRATRQRKPLVPADGRAGGRRRGVRLAAPARRGRGDRVADRRGRRAVVAVRGAGPDTRRLSTRSTAPSRREGCRSRSTRSAASGRAPRSSTSSPGCASSTTRATTSRSARLLLGPAYRLGRRDLFFLAERAEGRELPPAPRRPRRAPVRARRLDRRAARRSPELSDDARERITRFHATWRELAGIATRVSLADLVGEIARVSGLAAELAGVAESRRRSSRCGTWRSCATSRRATSRSQARSTSAASSTTSTRSTRPTRTRTSSARPRRTPCGCSPSTARRGSSGTSSSCPGLVKGHMPHPGKGGEQPDRALAAAAVRAPRRPRLPPAAADDEGELDQLRDEEERRLMYVGITRARRRLVLSRAWYYRDNVGPKEPSPFWEEALATGLVDSRERRLPAGEPAPARASSRQPDPAAALRARRRRTQPKSRGSSPSSSGCARSRRSSRPVRRGARRRRSRSRRS